MELCLWFVLCFCPAYFIFRVTTLQICTCLVCIFSVIFHDWFPNTAHVSDAIIKGSVSFQAQLMSPHNRYRWCPRGRVAYLTALEHSSMRLAWAWYSWSPMWTMHETWSLSWVKTQTFVLFYSGMGEYWYQVWLLGQYWPCSKVLALVGTILEAKTAPHIE